LTHNEKSLDGNLLWDVYSDTQHVHQKK